jgi:hypothetical protein
MTKIKTFENRIKKLGSRERGEGVSFVANIAMDMTREDDDASVLQARFVEWRAYLKNRLRETPKADWTRESTKNQIKALNYIIEGRI